MNRSGTQYAQFAYPLATRDVRYGQVQGWELFGGSVQLTILHGSHTVGRNRARTFRWLDPQFTSLTLLSSQEHRRCIHHRRDSCETDVAGTKVC